MCGIASVWSRDPSDRAPPLLAAAGEALRRRGPDGGGTAVDDRCALVHRRLAIVDLSERGAQPMSNEDGTVWLACNGEIFNAPSLRARLEASGHVFRSESDNEVVLHLYEETPDRPWEVCEALEGMFAFLLRDRRRGRLVAARDRFGIKPLHYVRDGDRAWFASDLDALAAIRPGPLAVDSTSVQDYLCTLTVPGPWTIYRDARALEPATVLVIEDGRWESRRWWAPPREEETAAPESVDAGLLERLRDAVRSHLVADVEVGAFLSGGLDSGTISALAARETSHPLRTFAATFPGLPGDESGAARQTAARIGAAHDEVDPGDDPLSDLGAAVAAMDQPLGIGSALSLHRVARRARASVKVVLSGDGGDEVLAGYGRHGGAPGVPRALRWIPPAMRPRAGSVLRAVAPDRIARGVPVLGRVRRAGAALAITPEDAYVRRLLLARPAAVRSLLAPRLREEADPGRFEGAVRATYREGSTGSVVNDALRTDLRHSLVDEMMAKADRMTMGQGLEARVPFLDRGVVEYCLRIPGPAKRAGATGKLPLRRIARGLLGEEAAGRPKQGFSLPLAAWLRARGDGCRAAVEAGADAGLLDGDGARAALGAFLEGTAAREISHPDIVFALVVLGSWARSRGVGAR